MLPQIMIAGIVLSFLYYEIVGLSPGGIIVCGYLVLYTGQPHRILSTLLISMLVLATGMLLQKWMVLFGKRKFGIYVLLGIFFSYVASHVSALDLMDWEMAGIGFIIPGLIGLDMERQGIVRTLVSMGIVLGILYLYVWLVIS